MNIVITPENFIHEHIFFNDPVKNTIMSDSSFIRILYSNHDFTLNGAYLKLQIYNYEHPLYSQNNDLINYIKELEKYILTAYNPNKIHSYKITEQLTLLLQKNDFDKSTRENTIILKLSGLWETNTHIGITYKFIHINRLLNNTLILH